MLVAEFLPKHIEPKVHQVKNHAATATASLSSRTFRICSCQKKNMGKFSNCIETFNHTDAIPASMLST